MKTTRKSFQDQLPAFNKTVAIMLEDGEEGFGWIDERYTLRYVPLNKPGEVKQLPIRQYCGDWGNIGE